MKKLTGAALAVAMLVSGCATHPNDIQATYVSPTIYSAWTCEQLIEENNRIVRRVDEVTGNQSRRANNDTAMMAVGMVLFWPALFFMSRSDQEGELARLKGEYDAVQSNVVQKRCSVAPDAAAAWPADVEV